MLKQCLILICLGGMLMTQTGCSFLINAMAFHPDRHFKAPLPEGSREVTIATEDGLDLQAIYLEHPDARKIVIYFHGNAGNIYHRLPDLESLHNMGVHVLGLSYRGYGPCPGRPSEKGIYTDGRAALAYARQALQFKPQQIVILGRSIGSTVAVNTAQNQKLGGVILVTPLSSAKAVARRSFGFLAALAGKAFDNLSKIPRLQAPLLVIHGTHDEVIPFDLSRQLYERAPQPKQFVRIAGGFHNDLSDRHGSDYWASIEGFLNTIP